MQTSFVLVGGDTLLCECAAILLAKGHAVVAIATDSPRVRRWAEERALATVPVAELAAPLTEPGADFLLAVTHLQVLPEAVLALPRRLAVNFHDGPLPRYAGLNCPVHALLAGEQDYAITWHEITAGTDRGRILLQSSFAIDPGETALSLNTRCFEVALETFPGLVDELVAGRHALREQVGDRTLFLRRTRPHAGGALDFTRTAAELEQLVRALDHGPYPNPMATPRLCHGVHVAFVPRLHIAEAEPAAAPGTVLAVGSGGLVVATADGAVRIPELVDGEGRAVAVAAFAERAGITAGGMLRWPADAGELRRRVEATAADEAFWQARLLTAATPRLPVAAPGRDGAPHRAELPLPGPFSSAYAGDVEGAAAAVLGSLLARLCDSERVTLAVAVDHADPLHAAALPIDVEPSAVPLGELIASMRITGRGPLAADLVLRTPALRQRAQAQGAVLPYRVGGDAVLARGETLLLQVRGDRAVLTADASLDAAALAALAEQFGVLLEQFGAAPALPVTGASLLSPERCRRQLDERNRTAVEVPPGTASDWIAAMCAQRADAPALFCEGRALTYGELDARADVLAARLQQLGVRPGALVGIHVDRSLELVVAVLATWKAGGAYLPLDPDYPAERIRLVVDDAQPAVVLSRRSLPTPPIGRRTELLNLDEIDFGVREAPVRGEARPGDLAYVIYTSGSTGKPKGVMVEHRNVVNFHLGMDARLPHQPGDRWLAVTSLSFDISVLELTWTLARGLEVVLFRDRRKDVHAATAHPEQPVDFSLFYFSSDMGEVAGPARYRLLMEGAKFADEHGFTAVWTPERHFHEFGGIYPNPAVTGAAVAAITKRVQIRAGSCVLPLHHPIRVAEAWQVIDNLSDGRVALAMASGWQPNDFVLQPQNFGRNKDAMFRDIEIVRRLWRGETVSFPGPQGKEVAVRTLPRPVQAELPIWITTAGNPETYKMAGACGGNVLTHLLGQSIEKLAPKLQAYREARQAAGFDPRTGKVTLMLHTYVAEGDVRAVVRGPLKRYLGTSFELLKQYAWAFPAFAKPATVTDADKGDELASLSAEERDALLEHAFERYFETSGLFGTVDECVATVDKLKAIGVDEIACLIDYGVPDDLVLQSLPAVDELRRRCNEVAVVDADRWSVGRLLRDKSITHLQCTPSMMRMLLADDSTHAGLADLRCLMIGGEALPTELVQEIRRISRARIFNMYGPTETTVWSSVHEVAGGEHTIPLGEPIANTQLFVLDRWLQPLPDGMAGELCIGGDGVARGYLGRPELTADRFVDATFGGESRSRRVYRTGDLVRYAGDGTLEFLGRLDHQVKVRGYRIELGEIENAIDHAGMSRECAVVAHRRDGGDPILVAYVVAGPGWDESAMRNTLRAQLPEFMVPSQFVTLAEMPRTPNQKIDRKALPSPERNTGCAVAAPSPSSTDEGTPADGLEAQIAEVWRKHLGIERVGPRDNFFDLGGHSLLVVRVHRELQNGVAPQLSLTDLYRHPTIASLARHLAGATPQAANHGQSRADRRLAAMNRRRV